MHKPSQSLKPEVEKLVLTIFEPMHVVESYMSSDIIRFSFSEEERLGGGEKHSREKKT